MVVLEFEFVRGKRTNIAVGEIHAPYVSVAVSLVLEFS